MFRQFLVNFVTTMFDLYLFCHIFACLWIEVEDWDARRRSPVYLNAIYFIYQTAAVVGYGDFTYDDSNNENQFARLLFAICVILFGATFVGYTFAMINKTIRQLKEVNELSAGSVKIAYLERVNRELVRHQS